MKVVELFESKDSPRQKRLDTIALRKDWARFKRLTNMPSKFLHVIAETDEGKETGMTARELKIKMQFTMPKSAAKAIIKMRTVPVSQWSTQDINWMYRILGYIDQKLKLNGPLMDKGKPTEKLKNLWAWGHVPRGLRPKNLSDSKV